MPEQPSRRFDLGPATSAYFDNLLIGSPEALWRAWIEKIVRDPEMNADRVMRHLQLHVQSHMPNEDAPRERWEDWLAGTYNLMAILSSAKGINPPFALGAELLLRKWLAAPHDYTGPPATVQPDEVPPTRPRPPPTVSDHDS